MSKLSTGPKVPFQYDPGRIIQIFNDIDRKVNGLSEGSIVAVHNAATASPSGTYAQGDFIRNLAPAEAGTAGSKYVILGWVCVDGSTIPGVFKECRVWTGG